MSIWYYLDAERQRLGPLSTDELKQQFRGERIALDTPVWREGMLQWRPLGDLAEQLGLVQLQPPVAEVPVPRTPSLPPEPPPAPAPEPPPPEPPPLTGRAVFSLGADPAPPPVQSPPPGGYARQADDNPYAPSHAPLPSQAAKAAAGEVVYAGFRKRFAAILIDGLITSVAIGLTAEALGTILSDFGGGGEVAGTVAVALVHLALDASYYAGFHSSFLQATPGKLAIGIKVVRGDGGQIGFLRGVGRYFATILSAIPLMGGFLMAAFTQRKQALHDMLCDTVVVDKWAFTDHPGMQRRELGTVATAVIAIWLVVIVGGALALIVLRN